MHSHTSHIYNHFIFVYKVVSCFRDLQKSIIKCDIAYMFTPQPVAHHPIYIFIMAIFYWSIVFVCLEKEIFSWSVAMVIRSADLKFLFMTALERLFGMVKQGVCCLWRRYIWKYPLVFCCQTAVAVKANVWIQRTIKHVIVHDLYIRLCHSCTNPF